MAIEDKFSKLIDTLQRKGTAKRGLFKFKTEERLVSYKRTVTVVRMDPGDGWRDLGFLDDRNLFDELLTWGVL